MPFRWVEHTGELEVELEADSERGLFEAGFEALRELLGGDEAATGLECRVEVRNGDRASLLADWLGELAFLGETRGLVPGRLAALELLPDGLRATVEGSAGSPPHLVKGATYHRLRLERPGGRWLARVVLDV
jgi:SHS2 domain-containing protein